MSGKEAAALARDLMDTFPIAPPSEAAVGVALTLASSGLSSYRDGLLVATPAEAGCTAILTEDLHGGGLLYGVRIVNPFTETGLSQAAGSLLGKA